MDTDEGATRLMKAFGEDNSTWTHDIEKFGLEAALTTVMRELVGVIGDATARLCVGGIFHNVDHDNRTLDAEGQIVWPDRPNLYDAVVVTDRLMTTTWGHISDDGLTVERETTIVKARKNISSVSVGLVPGERRSSGATATHHDLTLGFTDGSMENIPGVEDELTSAGVAKLAALLPGFYADMVA